MILPVEVFVVVVVAESVIFVVADVFRVLDFVLLLLLMVRSFFCSESLLSSS